MPDNSSQDRRLQIDEDARFQYRFWKVERWAWACFGLIILGALVGLTGDGGPLSRATGKAERLEASWPTVGRWTAQEEIFVRLQGDGDTRVLRVDKAFQDIFTITEIHPTPDRAIALPDGIRWEFAADPHSAAHIQLSVRPQRLWSHTYRISAGTGEHLVASIFVLP